MPRDYCICLPHDGLLYVEFPSYDHMRNLLLNQRFRGEAHFRTVDGYVPYYGAALAFDARALIVLADVRPLWYLRRGGNRRRAVTQLIADGYYADERDAHEYDGHHYGDECEWIGPRGMRVDPHWIEAAWIWPGRASAAELREREAELGWLIPAVPVERGKPEPPPAGRRSCR